jgi:hypothetical protein
MSNGLVIASLDSGGGIAMMGIVALIGAVVALVYLVAGRRRPDRTLDASEHGPDASAPARSGHDRSAETSDRRPTP